MNKWNLSKYTSIIECENGDILLHNSFMGSIAHIPTERSDYFRKLFKYGIEEKDLSDQQVKEMCNGYFFVPLSFNEQKTVPRVILKEREYKFKLIILPHENCNFRCVYCYETFERQKMNSSVVDGLKSLVKYKAKEYSEIEASWFGGEPLLAKDIIYDLSDSFIDSCKKNRVNYSSNITTNGFLLRPDVVKELLKRKVSHFQVTIDGPQKLHDINRHLKGGGGTYKTILDNLIKMRSIEDNFQVTIRINYNDQTIKYIEEFLSEISPLFTGDTRFSIYFHPISKMGSSNDSNLDTCTQESKWLKKLYLLDKTMKHGWPIKVTDYLDPGSIVCYAGKESSLIVRSDGKICKCTVALEDPRNIVGQLTKEGNLIIDKFLWNLWVKLDNKDDGKCDSCSFNPSCQSRACPLDSINEREPPCPYTKEDYEATVKLAAIQKSNELLKPKLIKH